MIPGATGLIAAFGETVTLIRETAGHFENGRWVEGTESEIEITASIQPISGNELVNLPELQRTSETLKCYTTEILLTADPTTGVAADEIHYRGKRWQVQSVEPWGVPGFSHSKAIIMRVG